MDFDLTQKVKDASQRASAPRPAATINRDAYPVLSPDFDAPGGKVRVVSRSSTGAEMLEFEPERGKVQRIDLAAIPAVGFTALADEHRQALADLFPEQFGSTEQEPADN
jgi:hypothetical protein